MKVLFCSLRYDPTSLDGGSGFDHDWYTAFKRNGIDPQVIGPFSRLDAPWERVLSRVYKKTTGLAYAKFRLSATCTLSAELNQAVALSQPDLVFTIWPNFLTFYRGKAPTLYAVDTCLYGHQLEWPTYGNLAMKITEWQEQKTFDHTTSIVTHSKWSKNVITDRYDVSEKRVSIVPVPSSLAVSVVPTYLDVTVTKQITFPLRVLLVGRVYQRKGVDIAIKVTELLNAMGLPAALTICGVRMASQWPYVRFVGPYRKSDPVQLKTYAGLYEEAHLLIHPARFEAAGIAPSEAAAFGTPTITNDVGGLATTVADGISGIVLPRASPPEAYAQAILDLVNDPERYYQLCQTTRERYERELNWDVAGKRLMEIVEQVVHEHRTRA